MNLVALQTKASLNFEDNLAYLEKLILKTQKESFVLACELALSAYSYENMEKAVEISNKAIERFLSLSKDRTIALTMTTKKDGKFFNTFFLFHKNKIIHKQSKIKLFSLGDENRYFTSGDEKDLVLFEVNGLKIGVLICFELRFIEFWQKLRGADIILVPAMWGKKRKENYETLSQALAVANQCFVIASDSSDEVCAKGSAIISPFGNKISDDNKEIISSKVDLKEIKKMRKYLDVGL